LPSDPKLHQDCGRDCDREHFDGFDFEQRLHLDGLGFGLLKYQGGLGSGQGGRDGFGFGQEHHHVGDPQLAGNENCYWAFARISVRILLSAQTVDGLPVLALFVVGGGYVVVVVIVVVVVVVVVALVIVAGVLQDD